MSNSNPIFLILILSLTVTLLLPTALSQPQPIQALLKRLDSKRASPSVQEAAAKAVLKRLLPGCYVPSFQFKIVHHVLLLISSGCPKFSGFCFNALVICSELES